LFEVDSKATSPPFAERDGFELPPFPMFPDESTLTTRLSPVATLTRTIWLEPEKLSAAIVPVTMPVVNPVDVPDVRLVVPAVVPVTMPVVNPVEEPVVDPIVEPVEVVVSNPVVVVDTPVLTPVVVPSVVPVVPRVVPTMPVVVPSVVPVVATVVPTDVPVLNPVVVPVVAVVVPVVAVVVPVVAVVVVAVVVVAVVVPVVVVVPEVAVVAVVVVPGATVPVDTNARVRPSADKAGFEPSANCPLVWLPVNWRVVPLPLSNRKIWDALLFAPFTEDESKATRLPFAESEGFKPEPEELLLPPDPLQLGTIAAARRRSVQVTHPELRSF